MKQGTSFSAIYPSPLGSLRVSGCGSDISAISMVSRRRAIGKIPTSIRRSLDLYFQGSSKGRGGNFVLEGTPFQKNVWNTLSSIPWGECISYAELARRVKRPKAVRAVAHAVGQNPVAVLIPCHRVIGSDGSLTGYAYGLKKKAWLLSHEKKIRG